MLIFLSCKYSLIFHRIPGNGAGLEVQKDQTRENWDESAGDTSKP